MASQETTFSPAEMCAWFDIPRTTLFRWEDEGLIPPAERKGSQAERVYHREHVACLFKVVREKMEHELDLAQRHDPYAAYPSLALMERMYLIEFFASDNPKHGLEQLGGLSRKHALKVETLRKIVEYALSRSRGDRLRVAI